MMMGARCPLLAWGKIPSCHFSLGGHSHLGGLWIDRWVLGTTERSFRAVCGLWELLAA